MADENATIESGSAQVEEGNTNETFTKEEVMKLIQSESDRRVTQALTTQQKKYEKQLSLANLDGEARDKAEKENTIAELKEQLAQFQIEKNRSELKSVLSTRGLSAEFADIITIGDDLSAAQENIDKLDRLFKEAVKAEVNRRIASNSPKGNMSTERFDEKTVKHMSVAQLSELAKDNPEVFNKYFGK